MKSKDLYPSRLSENLGKSFQGTIVWGQGFLLTLKEREDLIAKNPRNAERIFPYLGGKEVNTSPTQTFHRYIIDFGEMSEDEASAWPYLWQHLEQNVKPERLRKDTKRYPRMVQQWWKYWAARPGLYQAIAPLDRCLVTAATARHICFSFQPTDRIFSHSLSVFPFDDYSRFVILQSRTHEVWTRLLCSTLNTNLRYINTDCFETFPFPEGMEALGSIGAEYYKFRADYLIEHNIGLTQFYNDPPKAHAVLKKELDSQVTKAYDWNDSPSDDEVIDRLLVLNKARMK